MTVNVYMYVFSLIIVMKYLVCSRSIFISFIQADVPDFFILISSNGWNIKANNNEHKLPEGLLYADTERISDNFSLYYGSMYFDNGIKHSYCSLLKFLLMLLIPQNLCDHFF